MSFRRIVWHTTPHKLEYYVSDSGRGLAMAGGGYYVDYVNAYIYTVREGCFEVGWAVDIIVDYEPGSVSDKSHCNDRRCYYGV